MKKTYIIPLIIAIEIDREIALRLTSGITDTVKEPGSGGVNMGGEPNNSGEIYWERGDANTGGSQLNSIEGALWR